MGLIISILKTIVNRLAALIPIWPKQTLLPPNHPNNISAESMRAQIQNRLTDQLRYFELGVNLLNVPNARAWARQISRNQSIDQSLIQVVNVVCYTLDYPYAEIFSAEPTLLNTFHLIDYYVRNTGITDNYSLDSERAMRNMGFSTKNIGSLNLLWEVAGTALITKKPVWAGARDIFTYFDADRKSLISRAGFNCCFAVPVVKNRTCIRCLSFFRKDDRKKDVDLMRIVQGMLDEIVSSPHSIQHNPNGDPDGFESDTSVVSETSG